MPHPGPDLLQAALRGRRAAHQGDRRDPEPAGLHGRLPDHDGPGHVHHQRRRARRGQPARPLAGRLLHRHRGPGHRPPLYSAKVIPNRGAWLEFETGARDQLYVKVDRKRKLEATKLLRAVGYEQQRGDGRRSSAASTRARPPTSPRPSRRTAPRTRQEALIEVYKKLRPGDPPTGDNAEKLVESLFFNFRRYDLGRVGRYKFNKKLDPVAERMGIAAAARRAHHHPRGHRRHRRAPHRAQQRPRQRRTTSTTSATAASAPTASSSRTPSASASCAWSASSRSA